MTARVGVVGHVEWVDFAVVERLPRDGEIAFAREHLADAGGGGGVAAVHLARLAGTAELLTVRGGDDLGSAAAERLRAHGVTVHDVARPGPQPRAFAHLAADGERTITVLGTPLAPHGDDALPWQRLAELDGVYVTAGDAAAIRAARAARTVVATPRAAPGLLEAGIELDALVLSAGDDHEARTAERLDPPPALLVRTEGAAGGAFTTRDGATGRYDAAPPPGRPVDAFGCGDAFAAALTLALAAGLDREPALAYAARAGAAVLTGRGPYGADLAKIGPPA